MSNTLIASVVLENTQELTEYTGTITRMLQDCYARRKFRNFLLSRSAHHLWMQLRQVLIIPIKHLCTVHQLRCVKLNMPA